MSALRRALWVFATLALVACEQKDSPRGPAMTASASAAPSALGKGPETPAATGPEAGATAGAAPVRWAGTYTSERAAYFIPRVGDVPNAADWDAVKQRPEDGGAALGEGAFELIVDAATGRVRGTVEGPLGPATIAGSLAKGGAIAATVTRKDATDEGVTGTLVATPDGEVLKGEMRLSEWNAVVLRRATFTARRRP